MSLIRQQLLWSACKRTVRILPGRTRHIGTLDAVNPAFSFILFPSDTSNFPAAHHSAWDLSGRFMDPSE